MLMRRHKMRLLLMLAAFSCFALLGWKSATGQKQVKITGTYSDMYYNKEGGDVLGTEIKIVFGAGSYQGTLQIAEGEPSGLVVVQVKAEGNKIAFSIPDDNPYAGQFEGIVSAESLQGEFRFKGGGSEKVKLRRGESYWD